MLVPQLANNFNGLDAKTRLALRDIRDLIGKLDKRLRASNESQRVLIETVNHLAKALIKPSWCDDTKISEALSSVVDLLLNGQDLEKRRVYPIEADFKKHQMIV
ncbi:unnamed protein product [Closterium sp. Yama58-4]|nr:unnamed protein product [Closterium sp. Yama58-4]